jgi:HEAT repeat protein
MNPGASRRLIGLTAALVAALALSARGDLLAAAWNELVAFIAVQGDPIPASPPELSEHEVQELDALPPQEQAVRLLERTINHYDGAAELIASHLDGWRGKIDVRGTLNDLFVTAMDANDLRVRAAAIELYLAAYAIEKSPEGLDRIMAACDRDDGGRPHELYVVGLLGNRGVDPRRALDYLLRWGNDRDDDARHWAVEGIAMLGTDDSIAPLLRFFHDDPSAFIRERAACGLAQHGMLTEKQRWSAIPELLRFADDPALDERTRSWVFQALQDISGERLGHNARDWRDWWGKEPQPAASITR